MARFNIESKIFREQGFQDLLIAVGNRHTAKGIVWELFETAQEHWFPHQNLIPIEVFKAKGLPEVLFAPNGLAELRPEGVYVRGSKDAFQWLFEKAEAGRKSGAARRAKKAQTELKPAKGKRKEQIEHVFTSVEQTGTNVNEHEQTRTSLLSSPYSSLSSPTLSSPLLSVSVSNETAPGDGKKSHLFIKRYAEEWKAKHGQSPPLVGKDFGIAKRLAKTLSERQITNLIVAYFALPDPWLKKVKHPLELFESRIKEIAVFSDSGSFISRRDVMQADRTVGTATLLDKVRSGGVK